jgi:hypothetical protein
MSVELSMFGRPASDEAFAAMMFITAPMASFAAFMLVQLTLFHISLRKTGCLAPMLKPMTAANAL